METRKVRVYCINNKQNYEVPVGTSLKDVLGMIDYDWKGMDVLAAYVNHDLKELGFELYLASAVYFLTYDDADGRRCYARSLNMLCQKACYDLFPNRTLYITYHLPNGQYAEFKRADDSSVTVPTTEEDLIKLEKRMWELVNEDLRLIKTKKSNAEACLTFLSHNQTSKAALTKSVGEFFITLYYLDGYGDYFYGPMVYSTKLINRWSISRYSDGFCIKNPSSQKPYDLPEQKYQKKLSEIFVENRNWCQIIGAKDIATVNELISQGHGKKAVYVSEALHERKFAKIADMINERKDEVRLVLIAGPSSSGKTTTSKRIALQMKVLGLNPVIVAMDDYFVDRPLTPKDENGEYDFESVYALNLDLLNDHLTRLFNGEEITLPKFDFTEGKSSLTGNKIRMQKGDVLVMEGIHALNPVLTSKIDDSLKFKVYASALTTLPIDENNYISTTDCRKLRRMVRDFKFRGYSAEETIERWPSVTSGERKNIFPFQENADVMFNSSLLYELPMLKYYAEPLLRRISPMSQAYIEASRLLNFLSRIAALTPEEIATIPATSIMREFIGGSVFTY